MWVWFQFLHMRSRSFKNFRKMTKSEVVPKKKFARSETHRPEGAGGDLYIHVGADPEAHRREGAAGYPCMRVGAGPDAHWPEGAVGDPYIHVGAGPEVASSPGSPPRAINYCE